LIKSTNQFSTRHYLGRKYLPRDNKFRRVGKRRIKLQFKRWMKYSWNDQERIIRKYNVILLGHKTRMEKLKSLFKKSDRERNGFAKFNRYVSMISKGIDQFSKEMNKFSLNEKQTNENARHLTKGLRELSGVNSSNRYEGLSNSSKKDYSGLMGSSKRDYSALIG